MLLQNSNLMQSLPATKEISWDQGAADALWEYRSKRKDLHGEYFCAKLGLAITRLVTFAGKLDGTCQLLDYGCGAGHLLERLLTTGAQCYGVDSSEASVGHVDGEFAKFANWRGAKTIIPNKPLPFAPEKFDVVTCCETYEHIPDKFLNGITIDLKRVIKPGGILVLTVPFEEDFRRTATFCPFCHKEYHPRLHVQPFTKEKLVSIVSRNGFDVIFAEALSFWGFQPTPLSLLDASLRDVCRWFRRRIAGMLDCIAQRHFPNQYKLHEYLAPGPHLCVVSRKDR